MTLTLNVFGLEIATLRLDLPVYDRDEVSPVDRGIKQVSRWFTERLTR